MIKHVDPRKYPIQSRDIDLVKVHRISFGKSEAEAAAAVILQISRTSARGTWASFTFAKFFNGFLERYPRGDRHQANWSLQCLMDPCLEDPIEWKVGLLGDWIVRSADREVILISTDFVDRCAIFALSSTASTRAKRATERARKAYEEKFPRSPDPHPSQI